MNYGYWKPLGSARAPAREEVEEILKNDHPARRQYDKRVKHFEETPYKTLLEIGKISPPLKGSAARLQEWYVDLPGNRSGRMMFILSEGVASFLHFLSRRAKRASQRRSNICVQPRNERSGSEKKRGLSNVE